MPRHALDQNKGGAYGMEDRNAEMQRHGSLAYFFCHLARRKRLAFHLLVKASNLQRPAPGVNSASKEITSDL